MRIAFAKATKISSDVALLHADSMSFVFTKVFSGLSPPPSLERSGWKDMIFESQEKVGFLRGTCV